MLIKNAMILTFNNNNIINKGYIKIDNGIISKIGEGDYPGLEEDKEVIDASGKIVMPGFICTHSHIYSAFARGMSLKGGSTNNFIQILGNLWWRLDKKLTPDDIYYSAMVTLIDCIKNGVTCLFDHHASPNCVDGSLDVIEEAFIRLGMRGTLCYEVSDRDGYAVAKQGIEENVRFIKKTNVLKNNLVKGIFGLHASFTLSDDTLENAVAQASSLDTGFHIHAAEGQSDLEFCRRDFKMGVIERLYNKKIINSKSILAHCIHISESEKELLKNGIVVHNPESNMNNAVGYCDAEGLLARGVLVGLGSDGFSANHLRAIDTCYVLHKHENKNPNRMTPNQLIHMAIINNGLIASRYFDKPVGKIVEGASGDIILVDYAAPTPLTADNFAGHIVFGFNSSMITDTIINGKTVMKNREILGIDLGVIYEHSQKLASKLWDRF